MRYVLSGSGEPPSSVDGVDGEGQANSRLSLILRRMLRLEWLGQMAASVCWMASVFSYGPIRRVTGCSLPLRGHGCLPIWHR